MTVTTERESLAGAYAVFCRTTEVFLGKEREIRGLDDLYHDTGKTKRQLIEALKQFNPDTITAQQMKSVFEPSLWYLACCEECSESTLEFIEFESKFDIGSVRVCRKCLATAFAMMPPL